MTKQLISLLCFVMCCSIFITGCSKEKTESGQSQKAQKNYQWKMVTSWPKNFPGIGVAPERFAKNVEAMSNGRLKIKIFGAGELVAGLEVFDAVSSGSAEMGHSAAYYWKGKIPAAQFFTGIPFGMNAQETNGWLHYGGGMKLWEELYEPFNLIPMAAGNTGVQLAGWFKKEINSVDDLKGLKMRIPGLGGEVLKELGGIPVALAGGDLFASLQSGAIDATEWVGPYNDLAFGFYQAADYYYYSGWHEPSAVLELIVNKKAFESLPKDLQMIVKVAARASNQDMLDEYTARNNDALKQLVEQHNVKLKKFDDELIRTLKKTMQAVIEKEVAKDPQMKKVWDSYSDFQKKAVEYHRISEMEYYLNRDK